MADFFIEKLIVKGAGKKDAIAEFDKELTIISVLLTRGKPVFSVVLIIFSEVITFRLRAAQDTIPLCSS